MARLPRKISSSGYYHVFLRGINRRQIFFEDEDREKFFEVLKHCRMKYRFEVIAWCLMGNHIHLAIKDNTGSLSPAMQNIGVSFVYWYNHKYKRIGHLFQERFGSEPVEYGENLLRLVRYIHMNPVAAGICNHPADYPYSSFSLYFRSDRYQEDYVFFRLMRKDEFENYHFEKNEDRFLDISTDDPQGLSGPEASDLMKNAFGYNSLTEIRYLPIDQRNQAILFLREHQASIRQISEWTGISIRSIREVLKK